MLRDCVQQWLAGTQLAAVQGQGEARRCCRGGCCPPGMWVVSRLVSALGVQWLGKWGCRLPIVLQAGQQTGKGLRIHGSRIVAATAPTVWDGQASTAAETNLLVNEAARRGKSGEGCAVGHLRHEACGKCTLPVPRSSGINAFFKAQQ